MSDQAGVYTIPGSHAFDLAAPAGGPPYRIFLFVPDGSPPPGGWPLLVLTDGNATFPFAATTLVTQAPYPTATNIGWGVIAAIGYPGDAAYDGMRRSWDLTPAPGRSYPPFSEGGPPVVTGGAQGLLDFIETRLLPDIATKVAIDAGRRTLFGHSFGGLFTLFALFQKPDLFSGWVAASPTIYWEDWQMIDQEANRRRARGTAGFLHLSAGEYEGDELAPFQHHNEDAARRLEMKKIERTVDFAREMAQRLDGAPEGLRTRFDLHPGETHMSVLATAVSRAVNSAFAIRR